MMNKSHVAGLLVYCFGKTRRRDITKLGNNAVCCLYRDRWIYLCQSKTSNQWELLICPPNGFSGKAYKYGNPPYTVPDDVMRSKTLFREFFRKCFRAEAITQERNMTKCWTNCDDDGRYCMNGLPMHYPRFEDDPPSTGIYTTGNYTCDFFPDIDRDIFLSKQLIFAIKTYFRKVSRHRFHIDFSGLDDLLINRRKDDCHFFELTFTRKDRKRLEGTCHCTCLPTDTILDTYERMVGKGLTDGLYYDKSKKLTRGSVKRGLDVKLKRTLKKLRKYRYTKEI